MYIKLDQRSLIQSYLRATFKEETRRLGRCCPSLPLEKVGLEQQDF